MSRSKYSYHADRFSSALFASLWVEAWGEQYPVQVAPFSSCTLRLLQQLEQQLGLHPSDVLVDLGCGTGGIGLWLSRKLQSRLVGIDRCRDAIAIATKRASEWELAKSPTFIAEDFCETGLMSASVDAVVSIDALTAAEDLERVLFEVCRILKPNGSFVFTARELGQSSRHHETIGSDWREGLKKCGFEAINMLQRPEVPQLWLSLYSQWLKHEPDLRRELQPITVDAMIEEARQGIPKMNCGRPWYLIKATVKA